MTLSMHACASQASLADAILFALVSASDATTCASTLILVRSAVPPSRSVSLLADMLAFNPSCNSAAWSVFTSSVPELLASGELSGRAVSDALSSVTATAVERQFVAKFLASVGAFVSPGQSTACLQRIDANIALVQRNSG